MGRDRIAGVALAAVLAAAVLVPLGRIATQRPQPMKPEEFGRIVRQLESFAAETQLLALGLLEEKFSKPFVRTQRERLGEEIDQLAERLREPIAPPLAGEEARDLADRLRAQVDELQRYATDRDALENIAARAGRVQQQLAAVEPAR